MAEDLRQVIARIKSRQQSSQQSAVKVEKPVVNAPIPVQAEAEEEYIEEDEKVEDEIPKQADISPVKPQKQATEQVSSASQEMLSRQQELMLLQDNGIFRVQLLHQLQEINKALVVIAGVLVDLSNGTRKA